MIKALIYTAKMAAFEILKVVGKLILTKILSIQQSADSFELLNV